ncbi:MAG: LuxR C-terminal-related transcriptional regulator [Myxococcota bacterium]
MATTELLPTPGDLLTPRQLEVLELLAKGLTNREIAGILDIAPGTAKNHVAAVLDALDVTNRTEAAVALADWAAATGPPAAAAAASPGGAPPESEAGETVELRVPGFGDRPAIAVLPFDDWSPEPRAYFAEGLAEDLITRLATWRWFPVIARNSSFGFRGDAVDVREASRRLGARYVIEGSVRVEGSRARVTAQLLDGPSAEHVWADRWDVVLDEVFEAQDEIVDRIVGALEPALNRVERLRVLVRPVESLSAWEAAQRGLHHLLRQEVEDLDRARALFERCAGLDDSFAPGHWGLALTLLMRGLYGVGDAGLDFQGVRVHGERAAEIDPLDHMAQLAAAAGQAFTGDVERAVRHLDQGVALNPSSSLGCAARAWMGLDPDSADASADLLERAVRLSPLDPLRCHFLGPLAVARMAVGRFEEALAHAEQAVRAETGTTFTYRPLLASCLAHLGRDAPAREAGRQLLERHPDAHHGLARLIMPAPTFDLYRDGLERAGVRIPG